jgi:DNA polymerase-4
MFFVQVARLDDPEGVGKEPLLIVGGAADGRGVVTSASYEVRKFGVRSAMPTSQALRLCPDAVVVGVSRESVKRRSRAVRRTLEEMTPVVQAASVDEFYLDLTGTERLFRGETLEDTARRIQASVRERAGISLSVGGATQKMLAKLASGLAKPGGVRIVPAGQERAFMKQFRLADLPGVGPAFVESLRKRGLVRCEDVWPLDREFLEESFGPSRGGWLFDRSRGIDPAPVRSGEERKSVSSERTFARDIDDDEALEAILMKLVRSVMRTLRAKGFRSRTVTVKLRDMDFTTRQASRTLSSAVETDAMVLPVALELLRSLRARRRRPARLLGVGVSNLEARSTNNQLGLFPRAPGEESEKDRALSRTVDSIRDRFGDAAVVPGRILGSDRPSGRQAKEREEDKT